MLQEVVEILVRPAAVFAAEMGDLFGVDAVDGGDFDSGDGAGGASVCFCDVAAADEANVDGHLKSLRLSVLSSWSAKQIDCITDFLEMV
jgi:hypothetical protein